MWRHCKKMKKSLHIIAALRGSFAAKTSVQIVTFAAAVLILSNVIVRAFSADIMLRDADEHASDKLKIVEMQIQNIMSAIEAATYDGLWSASHCLDDTARIGAMQRDLLATTPEATGCTFSYAPGYMGYRNLNVFSFKHRQGVSTLTQREVNLTGNEWFRKAYESGKSHWTKPYVDSHARSAHLLATHIISYCMPLERDGKVAGVFVVDIPVDWFTKPLTDTQLESDCYAMLLADDGTIITHPNKSYLNKRLQDVPDAGLRQMARDIASPKQGVAKGTVDGKESLVYHKTFESTGWKVALVYSKADLMEEYTQLNDRINWVIAAGLLILLLVSIPIINHSLRPLSELAKAARRIARGDYSHVSHIDGRTDEVGQLYAAFAHMQTSLQANIKELKETTAREARISGELKTAHNIQMSLIPKNVALPPCIDVGATLRPAKEVGGDLYEFMMVGTKLYFAIGDVSGKGIPASLLMAITTGLFKSMAHIGYTPGQMARAINDAIAEDNDDNMFVTMFIGTIDTTTGEMHYCNAGHNPPAIIGADGSVQWLDVKRNIALGIMAGWEFEEQHTHDLRGSQLLLYTDGVTEAENAQHALFGEQQLIEALTATGGKVTAHQVVEAVGKAVAAHVGEALQSDDMAMLCISVMPTREWHLKLKNEISQLQELKRFIDGICHDLGLSDTMCHNLNLVMEEAVANVMMYAYEGGADGKHPVDVDARCDGNKLQLSITDSGSDFDPTLKADADVTLPLEQRREGGLGILLMRRLTDSMTHTRANGRNTLTMWVKIKD